MGRPGPLVRVFRPWAIASIALGCLLSAPGASAGEVVKNASYTGPKTTIRYAMWGGALEVGYSREICRRFVEKHPDIRLEVAVYPWGQYWTKLQTQAASGLAPDVVSMGPVAVWAERGALLALDDLVRRGGVRLEDYHAAAVRNCTWKGRLYSMPMEIPLRTLIYSVDKLEQSGVPRDEWPRPDEAMSWEAFRALAKKLTLREPDGTFAQYGMAAGLGWNRIMCRMYGGDILDRWRNPTRSTVLERAELERAFIEVFQAQYGDRSTLGFVPLSSGAFVSAETILISPKFAMSIAGPWALPTLKEAGVRFALAPMPRALRPTQGIGTNSVAIFRGSRRVNEAWTFIRFLASAEVQPVFGRQMKGVPALVAAKEALIHNDYGIEGCEAFLHDLADAVPINVVSATTYLQQAISKWIAETERILHREYESRLRALPRGGDGGIPEPEHEAFVKGMDGFVARTVRERLPLLDGDIKKAFARERPVQTGRMSGTVLPITVVLGVALVLGLYVARIRRDTKAERLARRPAHLAGYLCISPWLVGFACFSVGPILAALFLSFTEWNMVKAPQWVGAANYANLFQDEIFYLGLRKTLLYVALVVPISLFGGLFTAGLLTCNIRGADAFKAIFYFPSLFTGAATAVLWVNMFNWEYGVVNRLLSFLGISPVSWLDAGHAFYTVVLMNVFWVGGAMLIYYAGMKQIPRSLYEAADIDGAGPVRKFIYVTIPMLSPVILFMVVMTTIGAFQVFTPALFFARSSQNIGEPGDALRFYSVNIYNEAFNNLHMGKACGYALILFLIIFAVTMVQLKLSKRFVYTEA